MKQLLFTLTLLVIICSSCGKKHECTCDPGQNGYVMGGEPYFAWSGISKKEAEVKCQEMGAANNYTNCHLK